MLKYLWAIALAATATLSAETIGNLDFQFPPSKYEWKLLTDDVLLRDFISFFTSSPSIEETFSAKVFTHREGDALEILWVFQDNNPEVDEEDLSEEEEVGNEEERELVSHVLPNHKWIQSEVHEDLSIYAFSDGETHLLHGYARNIEIENQNTVLIYMSTAVETEQSRAMWLHTFESATVH